MRQVTDYWRNASHRRSSECGDRANKSLVHNHVRVLCVFRNGSGVFTGSFCKFQDSGRTGSVRLPCHVSRSSPSDFLLCYECVPVPPYCSNSSQPCRPGEGACRFRCEKSRRVLILEFKQHERGRNQTGFAPLSEQFDSCIAHFGVAFSDCSFYSQPVSRKGLGAKHMRYDLPYDVGE